MPTTLHAYLGYRDAPAAIAWLETVLGFGVVTRWPVDAPQVDHAELRCGDAVGQGLHRCRVLDPQGVEWTVASYRPGRDRP